MSISSVDSVTISICARMPHVYGCLVSCTMPAYSHALAQGLTSAMSHVFVGVPHAFCLSHY